MTSNVRLIITSLMDHVYLLSAQMIVIAAQRLSSHVTLSYTSRFSRECPKIGYPRHPEDLPLFLHPYILLLLHLLPPLIIALLFLLFSSISSSVLTALSPDGTSKIVSIVLYSFNTTGSFTTETYILKRR